VLVVQPEQQVWDEVLLVPTQPSQAQDLKQCLPFMVVVVVVLQLATSLRQPLLVAQVVVVITSTDKVQVVRHSVPMHKVTMAAQLPLLVV
jgi:hypothetical protein